MKPICLDDGYTFSSSSDFEVWTMNGSAQSTQIYSGHAVPVPSGTAVVYLNRFAQNLVSQSLITTGNASVDWCVKLGLYSNTTLLKSETYYLDDSLSSTLPTDLYTPIGKHPASTPLLLTLKPGTYTLTISGEASSRSITTTTGANVFIAAQPAASSITITGINTTSLVIPLEDNCCRYSLFYVGSHGQWVCLPCPGNVQIEDAVTRSTMETDTPAFDLSVPSRRNWLNTIDRTLTLHTGILTDDAAAVVPSLYRSTLVYLYDTYTADFTPCILATNTIQHQGYRQNGYKMNAFAIKVKLSRQLVSR